ncbi:MAG TPA: DsbA family protein [Acidimicrobiales bacterium]|jgi:predicted DsbA family dithiol-disulfide isomerase|nr:DsbA family protein [Acidimicrobiales bacterium]
MSLSFAVSWDYRCPFARNAHEHLVEGLRAGADWNVTFVPFSLNQVHVAEGDPDVWDDPTKAPALLAMQLGIAIREKQPEKFLDAHWALFSARHDDGLDIREADVLRDVLTRAGVDADAAFAEVEDGWTLETFRKEHEAAAAEHKVWGVPTFINGGQSVFVRLMNRPRGDSDLAISTIERVVDLVGGWPELNEFKHTSIPR